MKIYTYRTLAGIVIALLVGSFLYYLKWLDNQPTVSSRELKAAQQEPVQLDPAAQALTNTQAATAETISRAFVEHYLRALQQQSTTANTITTLLTPRAAAIVAKRNTVAEGLQYFARDSRLPDSITVTAVQKKHDTFAEATTTWHFGEHVETKYLYLNVVNDRWHADSIQTVPQ